MRTFLAVIASPLGLLLAVPIIVVCLPFWAVAFLTRRLCPVFERRTVTWQQVIEFDPIVGWRSKPNLNAYCDCGIGFFHVKTDSHGYRSSSSFVDSDMMVFGDSFAFGYGVDDEKTFFSERNTTLRIKAIGAPGYNMVQEMILMRQLSSHLQGKLVVWFIYFGNDLQENLLPNLDNYRMPFVRQVDSREGWEIVTSHLSSAKWPFNWDSNIREEEKYAGNFGINSQSDRVYAACEFLIRQGRDICSEAGARTVVLTIPMTAQFFSRKGWDRWVSRFGDPKSFNPCLPDRRIAEICSKLGVPLVAGQDHLTRRDLLPDGHWNERGSRRIAQVLQSVYHQFALKDAAYVDRIRPEYTEVAGVEDTEDKLRQRVGSL